MVETVEFGVYRWIFSSHFITVFWISFTFHIWLCLVARMTQRDDFNRPSNIFPHVFFWGGWPTSTKIHQKNAHNHQLPPPPTPSPPPKKNMVQHKTHQASTYKLFPAQTSYVVVYFQYFSCSPRCLGKRWRTCFSKGLVQPPTTSLKKNGGISLIWIHLWVFFKKKDQVVAYGSYQGAQSQVGGDFHAQPFPNGKKHIAIRSK